MASTINIYPTTDLFHVKNTVDTSSVARNGISGDSVDTSQPMWVALTTDLTYNTRTYYRSYFEFDVSSLVGNTITGITFYGEYASANINVNSPVVVYGGTGSLDQYDTTQYSLYLTKGTIQEGTVVYPWGTLPQLQKGDPATFSSSLDLTRYPVNPADHNIIVGMVSRYDFIDNSGLVSEVFRIYGSEYPYGGVVLPYIEVTYAASLGYPNTVMGIPGANITTVSGVPAANITNIMGV